MARAQLERAQLCVIAGFAGGCCCRPCSCAAQVLDWLNRATGREHSQCDPGQLAISCVSGHWHLVERIVCALHGARQHLTWRDAGALCHRLKKEPTESQEHVCFFDCLVDDHRLRWLGGSRGSYRLHRRCHWLQSGPGVQALAPDADAAGGLRCCRWHCGHLQGPNSRCSVCP